MRLDKRFGAGVAIMTWRTTLEVEYDKLKAVREEMRKQADVALAAHDQATKFFKTNALGAFAKAVDGLIQASNGNVLAKSYGDLNSNLRKRLTDGHADNIAAYDHLMSTAIEETNKLKKLTAAYDGCVARCNAAIPEAKRFIETGIDVPASMRPFFSAEKSGIGGAMKISPLALPSQRDDAPDPTSTAAMAFLGRVPQQR